MLMPSLSFRPSLPVQTRPPARPGASVVLFEGKPERKDVPTDPEKVKTYLDQLRAFPSTSRVLFVQVFELQLSDDLKHIRAAMDAGKNDPHMKALNDVILDALKKRQHGTPEEHAKANTDLASLGEAQLAFLHEIGRGDLANRYIAFKRAQKPR